MKRIGPRSRSFSEVPRRRGEYPMSTLCKSGAVLHNSYIIPKHKSRLNDTPTSVSNRRKFRRQTADQILGVIP